MSALTPEQARAVEAFFAEIEEVLGSVGRHDGHTLSKAGRCIYCSCGFRYQGSMPSAKERAECAASYVRRSDVR